MRDRHDEFVQRGARIAAIGMGWPEVAAHFKREFEIPFTLFVDPEKKTYKALQIQRGDLMKIAGPAIWLPWLRAQLSGARQGGIQQDPTQLGAAVVVAPGGRVLYEHRAKTSADNAPVGDLLAALPDHASP